MAIIIKKKPRVPAPEPVVEPSQLSAPFSKAKPKKAPGRAMDGMCRTAIKGAPMSIVPWWLMASYLYYTHDLSVLSDALYDELAKDMLARWDDIRHPHKRLITVDHLEAGSLFSLKEDDYPMLTRNAAAHLVKGEWGMNIDVKPLP